MNITCHFFVLPQQQIEAIGTGAIIIKNCRCTAENRHQHPCRRGCKRTTPAGILRRVTMVRD